LILVARAEPARVVCVRRRADGLSGIIRHRTPEPPLCAYGWIVAQHPSMKFYARSFPAILALTTVGALHAQTVPPITSDAPVILDEVEVTGCRCSLTVPTLAAAQVDLARTPGGVEVVDVERYLTGRASTLADTFFLSPGVVAQPRFGSDEARLSIRGSGLQRTFHGRGIRVLQDGVPVNLADGGFDMQVLEPTAAAYINVWRGGNALAYGSSTLGGAIDYISRTGRDAPGGFARLEAGSWDYLRATVAGGIAQENTDAYASFTQQQQDGFRDHARQNNQRLFTNAGMRFSDAIETRFFITAVKTRSELPGNLTEAQLEDDPRQANAGNVALDQARNFELLRVASKTTFITGDTAVDVIAAWTYKDLDHPIFQVIDQLSNDALAGLTLTNTSDLFDRDHRLRAGLFFNRGRTHAANFANVGGERGALLQRDEQTATNLEAFAESQLALGGGVTGIAGFTATRNQRDTRRMFGATPPNSTYDRTYEELAPKLGLRWDNAARDVQLFANVSGSYEPPSFSESGTAVIANDAQTATTFEIGTRGERGWFRWDLSAYHASVKDELLAVQLPPPAAPGATGTINADRTLHQGIEVALEADLLGRSWRENADHRLVLRGAWTYGRFTFDDDATYGDNTLAGLPPHLIRGELLWENAAGWYAGPTFEWVPVRSYIDHRNTTSADPYAFLGFKFGRRQSHGLSWFVEARNLTDEHYAATTSVVETFNPAAPAQYLPGDGRSLYAGIEYRF
jgi:iron complex outermembrane receptor protein